MNWTCPPCKKRGKLIGPILKNLNLPLLITQNYIIFRRVTLLSIAIMILLSGCAHKRNWELANNPQKEVLYEGPELPTNSIARVRVANVNIDVLEVFNEKGYGSGKLNRSSYDDIKFGYISEYHLKPGNYELVCNYNNNDSCFSHNPDLKNNSICVESANDLVPLHAEAGHYYTITHQIAGKDRIYFDVRDHGIEYDTKCKSVKRMTNVAIKTGSSLLPIECY